MSQHGWIGVDLDGTLAEALPSNRTFGLEHIGPPVPAMLARVKAWLAEGRDVRIVTARANGDKSWCDEAARYIHEWCLLHVGQTLPVTCQKDYAMTELWDDRAVQVEMNTGRRVDGLP
jgi:hypothetical protein